MRSKLFRGIVGTGLLVIPALTVSHPNSATMVDEEIQQVHAVLEKRLHSPAQVDHMRLAKHLVKVSKKFSFDPALILAVIQTESDFQTHAISRVGAVGLMQLLPSTARYFARKNGFHFYRKKEDLYNPYVNIVLGVGYLAYLRDRFKHSQRYLAAYNLGPTTVGKMVARNRFRLGKVTRYVHRIQRRSKGFRNLGFKQSATRLN